MTLCAYCYESIPPPADPSRGGAPKKYCSTKHRDAASAKRRKLRERDVSLFETVSQIFAVERRCMWCREVFEVRRKDQKFCGVPKRSCRQRWWAFSNDPRSVLAVAVEGRVLPGLVPRSTSQVLKQLRREAQAVRRRGSALDSDEAQSAWIGDVIGLLGRLDVVLGDLSTELSPARTAKRRAA